MIPLQLQNLNYR